LPSVIFLVSGSAHPGWSSVGPMRDIGSRKLGSVDVRLAPGNPPGAHDAQGCGIGINSMVAGRFSTRAGHSQHRCASFLKGQTAKNWWMGVTRHARSAFQAPRPGKLASSSRHRAIGRLFRRTFAGRHLLGSAKKDIRSPRILQTLSKRTARGLLRSLFCRRYTRVAQVRCQLRAQKQAREGESPQ